MNIFQRMSQDLKQIVFQTYPDVDVLNQCSLEFSKNLLHGDISTNIAMIIASKQGVTPREIALNLKKLLSNMSYISHIEVAGPGFINITIKVDVWHSCIRSILDDDPEFWEVNVGKGKKVNIEYVSANPTGPIHIGHARGAVYGDVLANILIKCGYQVTKEYYVNDAGSQINILIDSVMLRYKEAYDGKEIIIPQGLYPGEYLKDIGQKLVTKYQDKLLCTNSSSIPVSVKYFILDEMMRLIKSDLSTLGVYHDIFFSEQSLHDEKKIEEAVDILQDQGLIYYGTLPSPKGKSNDHWKEKKQMLFRSSNFGDEQDRPIKKDNTDWSYLAADFAYAKNKIDRGFDILIYILGTDHSGYIKRIKAVISALSNNQVVSDIRTSQIVNFMQDGTPIKMSKRNGHFTTVSDVVKVVGKDIIRFVMLTRSNDMSLNFDFDKVKEQSKDNPVFYVQYAYVRIKSIMQKSQNIMSKSYFQFQNNEFDLSLLQHKEEINIIKLLSSWPKVLYLSAIYREPQRIAYFLIDVASSFHSIWNLGKENKEYRFNAVDYIDVSAARLALAASISKIIAEGFNIMGITPMDRM